MRFLEVGVRHQILARGHAARALALADGGEASLFGLSGNPVSSMVSFEQFIRPAILKMRG